MRVTSLRDISGEGIEKRMTNFRWVGVVILLLFLLGCNSFHRITPTTPAQRFHYAGQALDVGTTAYALCFDNLVEQNPVLKAGGGSCAQVVVTSIVFKWLLSELLFHFERHQEGDMKFWLSGSIGAGAGLYNLHKLSEEN